MDDNPDKLELLVLLDQQLQIFLNSITPEPESPEFLGALDYTRQRNNYEIDIRQIIDNVQLSANPLLEQVQNKAADQVIDLPTAASTGDIIPARLNRDGIDDVFLFTDFDSSYIHGLLLLSSDVGAQ